MTFTIDAGVAIGTVKVSVADLTRSVAFYEEIGLAALGRLSGTASLGVDGAPLLALREVPGARLAPRTTGLYHFALRLPSRQDLARFIRRCQALKLPLGTSNHIVSESVYLTDPDGHGIEVYADRPRSEWFDQRGQIQMDVLPLDLTPIMQTLEEAASTTFRLPSGTDMGHVHLQISNLAANEQFYSEVLGFTVMLRTPVVSFVSAGGYHHHLALNSLGAPRLPSPPEHGARLLAYELLLPTQASVDAVLGRLHTAGTSVVEVDWGWEVMDPSANRVVLRT